MTQIGIIQILRAVAAMMIVLSHAQNDAMNESLKAAIPFARSAALPWDAGVDLFFVISGFIMVHASERLFAVPGAAGTFISRRLIRIVPLYWLTTGIALVVLAYVAWLGKRPFPAMSEIASSLGFIPFARPGDGMARPIAPQGWTLNYEMFFYALFTIFIGFRREKAVAAVALTLAAVVGAGALFKPDAVALAYWSDPIVLEFALGMGVALAWRRGFRLPLWAIPIALAAALGVLAIDLGGMGSVGATESDSNGFGRLLACGIPMALVFGCLVLSRPAFQTRDKFSMVLARLGDASYALYLFHPMVIIAARKAFIAASGPVRFGYWPLIIAELALSAALSLLIHYTLEKPITMRLHLRMFRTPGPPKEVANNTPQVSTGRFYR